MEFNMLSNEQIKEIWEEQKHLDDEIRVKNNIPMKNDLTFEKYIALKTELFEFANKIEAFKFWKKHKGKEGVLEEGIDAMHFIFSLAIEMGVNLEINEDNTAGMQDMFKKTIDDLKEVSLPTAINENIVIMDLMLGELVTNQEGGILLPVLVLLCMTLQMCDYSIEDIYNAYIRKNEINHKRQEENY